MIKTGQKLRADFWITPSFADFTAFSSQFPLAPLLNRQHAKSWRSKYIDTSIDAENERQRSNHVLGMDCHRFDSIALSLVRNR